MKEPGSKRRRSRVGVPPLAPTLSRKRGEGEMQGRSAMARRARDILLDILRDEGDHPRLRQSRLDRDAADGRAGRRARHHLRPRPAGSDGGRHGRRLGAGRGNRAGFVNLHAMGGLGNAMGVLVASKASETPLVVTAGQQDTRHLMTEPWLSGDLVALAAPVTKWAQRGAARRGRRAGAAPRLRHRPHAAVRAGVPVVADGHPRSGGQRPDAAGLLAAAARRLARRGARSPRRLAGHDPDKVVVLLGDDLPAAASAGLVAFAEAAGFPVWGTQLTSRAAFPSAHPCWAGVLKPDFAVMRAHFEAAEAIVLVGGRAFVAYPYRDAQPVPEGVAVPACRRQSPRRSAASTPPTWRCSATSALTLASGRRTSARVAGNGAGRGAVRRPGSE